METCRFDITRIWVCVVFITTLSLVCQASTEAAEFIIVSDVGAEAEVVIDLAAGEVIHNAAQAFVSRVKQRTGVSLPIRYAKPKPGKIAIYFGVLEQSEPVTNAIKSIGYEPVTAGSPSKEGFLLASGKNDDGAGVVVVNGCDELGAFHGVGWLLRKMRFSDGKAVVPIGLKITTAPATWQRRIRFADHTGYINTKLDGWKEILTEYALWGLSSNTSRCDPAHQGDPRETEVGRNNWNHWCEIVPLTKSLGLAVTHGETQVILVARDGEWGPANIPDFKELNNQCCDNNGINPKTARGREVIRESRKWFFENLPFADQVDYFHTSGFDTGGCMDPEVAPWAVTYTELTSSILHPLITKCNPKAETILGLYFVPDVKALGEKMQAGWRPEGINAVEFAFVSETDYAYLFPAEYKKLYFPMWATDFYFYGSIGANPKPKLCESEFRHVWEKGVRDGLGTYSEASHEYINQIMLLQLGWDPTRRVDDILDEICVYYFGEKAAPVLKEAFLLMEQEQPENFYDPQINPKVQELVAQAGKLIPDWVKSSREWAFVVGRANIDRTRRRQADLLAEFDQRWQEYQSQLKSEESPSADYLEKAIRYFQAVAENGWDMENVYKRMDRDGFGIQGGNQQMAIVWADPRTAGAVEALDTLKQWKQGVPNPVSVRTAAAYVGEEGQVRIADGYSHVITLSGLKAVDAKIAIADRNGGGRNEVVFLSDDGRLYRWDTSQGGTGAGVLAKGEFLTGPVACGDVDKDGKDEVVVLVGTSEENSQLAIVNVKGNVLSLEARPCGQPADNAAEGVLLLSPVPARTAKTSFEPFVVICDADSDGTMEIACSDRTEDNRLVILDSQGHRKKVGPVAPAGVLAEGDINGDGLSELLYLNIAGQLAAFNFKKDVIDFEERIRPKWKSSVAVVRFSQEQLPTVVFTDQDGYIRKIGLTGKSRRLTEMGNSLVVGPGLVIGDFNGDGRNQICCLHQRLYYTFPLAVLSAVDELGGFHDFPLSSRHVHKESGYTTPLGPRVSGKLRFPSDLNTFEKIFGNVLYRMNWTVCGELDLVFEPYTIRELKKAKEQELKK